MVWTEQYICRNVNLRSFCDSILTRKPNYVLLLRLTFTIAEMESKVKNFDGSGDVKVFLEKVKLHSLLKGYTDEKAAQNLASKLEGRAFDVYMRLSVDDKKNVTKITD